MSDKEMKCGVVLSVPLSDIEKLKTTDEVYDLVSHYVEAGRRR